MNTPHGRIAREACATLQFDQWFMLGAALLLLLFLYSGRRLSRFEGIMLLAGYGCYIGLGVAV